MTVFRPCQKERPKRRSAIAEAPGRSPGGPTPDQSAYEPLFRSASDVLAHYRELLGVKSVVPEELAKINGMPKTHSATKTPPSGTSKMRKTVPPPK